ncbi:MAG: hypothetical protein IT558_01495 [Alphaproteobacteria bacterium]|nr:hypothetical protein [Alphaproteobacteria bacterium]
MSEAKTKEKGRWFITLSKIAFYIIAFFLVMFTVLANIGGDSEALKLSIEQYAAENSGMHARVGKLNRMTFFPTISFDFEDTELRRELSDDIPAVHVDRVQLALSFWDVSFGSGKIKAFGVDGLKIMPGVWLDKTVEIRSVAIYDEGEDTAKVEAKGFIGATPVTLQIGIEAFGKDRSRKYRIGLHEGFSVALGDIKIEGKARSASDGRIHLQDINVTLGDEKIMEGHIEVTRPKHDRLALAGQLTLVEHGSDLNIDLQSDLRTRKFSGMIMSPDFHAADVAGNSKFDRFAQALVAVLADPQKDKQILDAKAAAQDISIDLKGPDKVYGGKLAFKDNAVALP